MCLPIFSGSVILFSEILTIKTTERLSRFFIVEHILVSRQSLIRCSVITCNLLDTGPNAVWNLMLRAYMVMIEEIVILARQ